MPPQMETAFVQHVGKHTRFISELLRAVRFASWTVLVLRHLLQARLAGAAGHATAGVIVAVFLATTVEGELCCTCGWCSVMRLLFELLMGFVAR